MRDILSVLIINSMLFVHGASAQDTVEVSQAGRRFHPESIEVTEGTDVEILNDDRFTHHISFDRNGKTFDSGEQPPGETIRIVMDEAGVYDLRCAIHPKMQLQVTVTPQP